MENRKTLIIPNDLFFEQVALSLDDGRKVTFNVKGYSMFPFFRNEKDSVCVEKYDGRALSRGEVILFRFRGKYILHRIYSVEEVQGGLVYKTMGDGNIFGEETARPQDIIGVATGQVKPSGRQWSCSSLSWRLLSGLWMRFRGVRRWLLAVLRRIYR